MLHIKLSKHSSEGLYCTRSYGFSLSFSLKLAVSNCYSNVSPLGLLQANKIQLLNATLVADRELEELHFQFPGQEEPIASNYVEHVYV